MSTKRIRARLLAAKRDRTGVQLDRASRPGQSIDGFVVGVGRKWVLLASTVDGYFDGHFAVRLREVARVRPDTSFQPRFSRMLPEWPPRPPAGRRAIELDTTSGLLATLLVPNSLFLVEHDGPRDALWVGVPERLTSAWLSIWEVGPAADWDDEPTRHRVRAITVVAIGTRYLRALAAIADDPTSERMPNRWAGSGAVRHRAGD